MRTLTPLALLVALALTGPALAGGSDPNDRVYFSTPIKWWVGATTMAYRSIPYKDLDCPATNSCYYTLPACQAVLLGKQTPKKTSLWTAGGRWVVKGDLRAATHRDRNECLTAYGDRLADAIKAAAKDPNAP